MNGKKVLLIDDDNDLLLLVCHIFENAGAQVITACDGLDGISKLFIHHPNLIILDIMMPGQNGVEVCKRIRKVTDVPLILLTAQNNEKFILEGLEAGADDFVAKPFNSKILLARAAAVLRRNNHSNRDQPSFDYDDGYLKIDTKKHRVFIKGVPIKLTPVEFRLLSYLAAHAEKTLRFEEILHNVWGSEYKGSDDYVHVYISQLRKKIEPDTKHPHYLISVRGIGYIFEKNPVMVRVSVGVDQFSGAG